jgi:hypothetical protein
VYNDYLCVGIDLKLFEGRVKETDEEASNLLSLTDFAIFRGSKESNVCASIWIGQIQMRSEGDFGVKGVKTPQHWPAPEGLGLSVSASAGSDPDPTGPPGFGCVSVALLDSSTTYGAIPIVMSISGRQISERLQHRVFTLP